MLPPQIDFLRYDYLILHIEFCQCVFAAERSIQSLTWTNHCTPNRVGIVFNLKSNHSEKTDDEEAEYDSFTTVHAIRDTVPALAQPNTAVPGQEPLGCT